MIRPLLATKRHRHNMRVSRYLTNLDVEVPSNEFIILLILDQEWE